MALRGGWGLLLASPLGAVPLFRPSLYPVWPAGSEPWRVTGNEGLRGEEQGLLSRWCLCLCAGGREPGQCSGPGCLRRREALGKSESREQTRGSLGQGIRDTP